MSTEVTPEIRQEVIEATKLCPNPNCTGHDALVARIWEYKCEAETRVLLEKTV